jgi:serine protease inhibitor
MFRLTITSLLLMAASSMGDPIADLSAANNRFAVALLHELTKSARGNLVFSPVSLEAALCMTYAGARGETAQQMEDVLEIDTLGKDVHAAQQDLSNNLRITCNSDTIAKLSIANALWNATCTAKADFTKLLYDRYGAQIQQLPADPAAAANLINEWADVNTEHKVRQIVQPEDLSDALAIVLTNAVYFLGRWSFPFEAHDTRPRTFWLSGEDGVEVPTMACDLPARSVKILQTDEFQAIELPYKESTAAMIIVLPRERDGLQDLESSLSCDSLQRYLQSMQPAELEVALSLPKVKTEGRSSMTSVLRTLGMVAAFEPYRADFSGICGNPGDVYVTDVIHATFLEIDERGTEAAAVTAITMSVTSVPMEREKIVFNVDHSFLFVLRDTATNAILFMGHITDPRG